MLTRYHITLGATTSAGGKVISASTCRSINGARVAREGDTIACPACSSNGFIALNGPRLSESDNGRQVALSDDLCICKMPLSAEADPAQITGTAAAPRRMQDDRR